MRRNQLSYYQTIALAVLTFGGMIMPLQGGQNSSNWFRMKPFKPLEYVALKTETPMTMDGRLDEPAWSKVTWTTEFKDIEGDSRPKPRFWTKAKMMWDDRYFYIGVEMEEPHLSGKIRQRDAVIFYDNDFEVFVDPDGDTHEYFELELNALNTVWDLFLKKAYKDGGPAINKWELVGLKTAVHLKGTLNNPADKDEGWSVEIAIPWKAFTPYAHLPTPPGDGDQWRVNFSRVEWQYNIIDGKYVKVPNTREDNWVWSPQGIIDMHRPERWGRVQFSTAAKPFVPDPAAALQDALHEVYYLQRDFREANKRWAASIAELGISTETAETFKLSITPTPKGYEASGIASTAAGAAQKWTIGQDARLLRSK